MLRATGVIRHIDELGRIVVPKEIRNTLRLKEGVSMEIYTTANGELILKKYCPIDDISQYAESMCNSIRQVYPITTLIAGTDKIVAKAGKYSEDFDNVLKEPLLNQLEKRQQISLTSDIGRYVNCKREVFQLLITPVIVRGDLYGGILMASFDGNIPHELIKVSEFATTLIQEQFI